MPSQIKKLEAHTGHLLDGFIRLRERYSILAPMLFSEEVIKLYGTAGRTRGFWTLRKSLFLSCAQDIAKLSLDRDKRAPSIRNIMIALDNKEICDALRNQFANWSLPSLEEEKDPEIIAAIQRIELREQGEKRVQFDEILTDAKKEWALLAANDYMTSFLTIRDKVTAHTEIRHVADKYEPIDLSDLGLTWNDLTLAINAMQSLIEKLGTLIRNAGFAWDSFDYQVNKASKAFWVV